MFYRQDKCLPPIYRYKTWLIRYYYFLLKEESLINEIGDALKSTREASGLSLDEVSKDLNIPVLTLEQIESSAIGAFKDIFELKRYLTEYSKYLGLKPEEVIDEFNEFMFEKTSKLPMKKIEMAAKESMIQDLKDDRIASPYTKEASIKSNKRFIISIIVIIVLVVLVIFWSIKQITIGDVSTDLISYLTK